MPVGPWDGYLKKCSASLNWGDYLGKSSFNRSLQPFYLPLLQATEDLERACENLERTCENAERECEEARVQGERIGKEKEALHKELEERDAARKERLRIIQENNGKFRKSEEEWWKKRIRMAEEEIEKSRRLDEGRDTEQFKPCNGEGLRLGSCKEKPTVKVAPKKTCLENTPTFTQGKTSIENPSPPSEPVSSPSVSRSESFAVEANRVSVPVQRKSFVAMVINAFKQEITSLLNKIVDCFKFLFKKMRLS